MAYPASQECWVHGVIIVFYCRCGLLGFSGMLGTWCCHGILLWMWLAQSLVDVGYMVLSSYFTVGVSCSASQECWVRGAVMVFYFGA